MSLIKGRFHTDKQYRAIIDKVIAGDRVVSHVYFDDGDEVELVTLIAGIKTPRSADLKNETAAEPLGDEAKAYVTKRLLEQKVHVTFVGTSSTDVPIVKISHPNGNISATILAAGLAEVADWQSQFIGAQGMSMLRAEEKKGKTAGKGLWKSLKQTAPAAAPTTATGSSTLKVGATINATIGRVDSADRVLLYLSNDTEQLVNLTSIRAPRTNEPYGSQAKEFVRKYVGKSVQVLTDAFRNETPLVTITLQNGKNLAETIVLNGFATVIRHRRGDEDRSSAWDSLIEAESVAVGTKRGIHSSKPPPATTDDSLVAVDATRAKMHLRSLKNKGKFNAYVDFIISPTRIRINIPSPDSLQIALVLAGVMGPPKLDPQAAKTMAFNQRHILQRDVTVEVFDVDKFGGFIGSLTIHGQHAPYQLQLLKEGQVKIHESSLSRVFNSDRFYDAEEEALEQRRGIWIDHDPVKELQKKEEEEAKKQAKYELKMAKFKKPNPFDDDDEEEEDFDNLPEAVRKLIIKH